MQCLDALVPLRDTCGSTSGSGLSLQSAGITETFLASITGPEDTPASLEADVRAWASAYLRNNAVTVNAEHIVPHTLLQNKRIGAPADNDDLLTASGRGGIYLDINAPGSNLVLNVSLMSFYGAGDTTVDVVDLFDGTIIQSVPLVNGQRTTVTIALPAHRERKRYLLMHDETTFREMVVESNQCNSCAPYSYILEGVTAYGGRIADSVPLRASNVQRVSHTSGLSIIMTLNCDTSAWLCESASILALPYLNLLALGFMRHAIAQVERMNNTTYNREVLEERAKEYAVEYKQTMENALANVRPGSDSMCFRCRPYTQLRVGIP